jgi:hypothetical protein
LLELLGNTVQFVFLALLILGSVQCRRHSFVFGFYFFLILIISRLYPYISHVFLRNYFDSNVVPPMGLSLGEMFFWHSLIPRILEVIAFVIFVFGLNRLMKYKSKML